MLRINAQQSQFHKVSLIITLIIVMLAMVACQASSATPTRSVSASDVQVVIPTATIVPFIFKTSEPGMASAHGILLVLNPMVMVPAPDDAIYLVPIPEGGISTIPQFEVGTVPQAEVDERIGEFTATNLSPGQYAVVVVTRGGAQIPARFYETGNYAIFKVTASQADTIIELGKLSFP